jgi:dihydroorotase
MRRVWSAPAPAAELLIKGARVVDPQAGIDGVRDVLIRKGRVAELGEALTAPKGVRVVDAAGMVLLPGFVDLHVHLRTPGREDEEDLATGTTAAAAGGYVAIFAMANTDPVVDTAPVLQALAQRAAAEAAVATGFFAAVSRGLAGEQLTEMHELGECGAVGFSDDGRPLATSNLLRRALQYAKVSGRFVAVHAQDDSLMAGGVMHEGAVSARLGLTGIPSIAESVDVQRALEVAAYEDGYLLICHISTSGSLEHLERAKAAGAHVTAEATPHHLTMTDERVLELDANLKMNPPLRSEADRAALVAALKSGLVDCVATDHAPHAPQEKDVPFEEAEFGTTGLETAFAALHTALVVTKAVDLPLLVRRMSQDPARIAGMEPPTMQPKAEANCCLVDLRETWTVTEAGMRSRSRNSAWLGSTLKGRVKLTVAAGHVAFDAGV